MICSKHAERNEDADLKYYDKSSRLILFTDEGVDKSSSKRFLYKGKFEFSYFKSKNKIYLVKLDGYIDTSKRLIDFDK